jgi:hypothetical protein
MPMQGMRGPGGMGMQGMAGGEMGQMMQRMMAMHRGAGAMRPFQRIEGRLAYVRAELRITEAQAPQWNAFADTVRSQAETLRQAHAQAMQARAGGQAASAPELLDRRVALLAARLDAMRVIAAAARPLYDALSDEQKRTADELMTEYMPGMRMRGP